MGFLLRKIARLPRRIFYGLYRAFFPGIYRRRHKIDKRRREEEEYCIMQVLGLLE